MEIKLKKKEDEIEDTEQDGADELPIKTEEPSLEEKTRRLEIENAELRGFQKASQERKPSVQSEHEQTKMRVNADMAAMDDEKFQQIYRMSKSDARATLAERDAAISRSENQKAIAEAEAKVEMATKFGADFYRYKDRIEEGLADLSDEARKDPKKVSRAMERMFLSLQREGFAPKPTGDPQRKKIVTDFEKPTHAAPKAPEDKTEEIPDQYKPFSKVFGIRDEKERKELMKQIDEGEFVPMDMGQGYWFKHPSRGFEKIETKK